MDCKYCGQPFELQTVRRGKPKIYCSRRCQSVGYHATDAKRDRSPRPCKECGGVFSRGLFDKRVCFCSDACRRRNLRRRQEQATRARLRKVSVESVDPIAVFDRDKWRCQLCGVPTPRKLRAQYKPNSPELDHIVPLAAGGEHSYRNTQCACRSCNNAKRAKPLGQMRLFG